MKKFFYTSKTENPAREKVDNNRGNKASKDYLARCYPRRRLQKRIISSVEHIKEVYFIITAVARK